VSDSRPIHHLRYIERIQVIEVVEEWRSKEDFHGGPGYYLKEVVLGFQENEIKPENLRNHLKPRA
jgi:hypothetical protein